MKLDKQALSAALKMVSPIISSNPIIPAQAGVKITEKYLTGGNSWISVAIPIVLEMPDCILDYQILSKTVNSLSEEIDIEMEGEVAVLRAIEGKLQVPVIAEVKDFPVLNMEFKHESFTLSKDDIGVIAQLANFIQHDDFRPLKGVFYDGSMFTGSDGHVIAVYHKETAFGQEVLFPKDLFKVLLNIGADEYEFSNGIVTAKLGDKKVAFVKYLLHEEQYPAVKQLLDSFSFNKSAEASQYHFSKAFGLLDISVDGATKMVEFNIEPDSGITGITGKEELNTLSQIDIDSSNDGVVERFEIGYNLNLLSKSLKFLGGSQVKMELREPSTATRITSDIEGRSLIIMPIALPKAVA